MLEAAMMRGNSRTTIQNAFRRTLSRYSHFATANIFFMQIRWKNLLCNRSDSWLLLRAYDIYENRVERRFYKHEFLKGNFIHEVFCDGVDLLSVLHAQFGVIIVHVGVVNVRQGVENRIIAAEFHV